MLKSRMQFTLRNAYSQFQLTEPLIFKSLYYRGIMRFDMLVETKSYWKIQVSFKELENVLVVNKFLTQEIFINFSSVHIAQIIFALYVAEKAIKGHANTKIKKKLINEAEIYLRACPFVMSNTGRQSNVNMQHVIDVEENDVLPVVLTRKQVYYLQPIFAHGNNYHAEGCPFYFAYQGEEIYKSQSCPECKGLGFACQAPPRISKELEEKEIQN